MAVPPASPHHGGEVAPTAIDAEEASQGGMKREVPDGGRLPSEEQQTRKACRSDEDDDEHMQADPDGVDGP